MSKLLLLTPQSPYPPHQGTSLRNFHIIRGLAERHQITLLSFVQDGHQNEPLGETPLAEFCEQVISVPAPEPRSTIKRLWQMLSTRLPDMVLRLDSRRYEVSLRRIISEQVFDIVQVEGIEMAWVLNPIRQERPEQLIVFDAHNAEALLQSRALQADLGSLKRWPAAAYSWVQQNRLRRFEAKIGDYAGWITAVSQVDKDTLAAQLDNKQVPISVIPNCIDVAEYDDSLTLQFPTNSSTDFDLVFIGKMDYRPNVDAVIWFADKVWPHIVAQREDATWAIVGQKPHVRLDHLQEIRGITVTGWVDRVQPYLAGARVFVMPFRVGSGTRLKLIEALAAGKAVVSTPLGVEGYPVEDGRQLLLAETAEEMSDRILQLLQDKERRDRLGVEGRIFAKRYDWRSVIPMFDEVYDGLSR